MLNWKGFGCSHGLIRYYPENFLEAFVLSDYPEKSDAFPHQFFQGGSHGSNYEENYFLGCHIV
jgi:hypothetical protein